MVCVNATCCSIVDLILVKSFIRVFLFLFNVKPCRKSLSPDCIEFVS